MPAAILPTEQNPKKGLLRGDDLESVERMILGGGSSTHMQEYADCFASNRRGYPDEVSRELAGSLALELTWCHRPWSHPSLDQAAAPAKPGRAQGRASRA